MRLIDADTLKADYGMADECKECRTNVRTCEYDRTYTKMDFCGWLDDAPTVPQWISVSERLPEEPFGCLVTVWDTNPVTMDEFENILPYFVGWDGAQWNDADGEQCPFEVIAWMPLPEPYKEGEG